MIAAARVCGVCLSQERTNERTNARARAHLALMSEVQRAVASLTVAFIGMVE